VVEILIAFSILSGVFIPSDRDASAYIMAYLVLPTALAVIDAGITTILTVYLIRRKKYAAQAYLYLTSLCVMCAIIVCVHCNLLAAEAVFCLPIILSLTYVDRKPLIYSTALSLILYIVSVFIIRHIAAGQEDILPGLPTALTMTAIILVAYLIANWSLLRQKELMGKLIRMEQAAYTDALTGLYNRRWFLELAPMNLDKAKRLSQPCYALMLDLDLFKNVNDTYGHKAGDEVLKASSSRVFDVLRSYDLLARYGGEEFVILLTDINHEDAVNLAERIKQTVGDTVFLYGDFEIPVTVSIGVAESLPLTEESLPDLLRRADKALYAAKAGGRNQVVFYSDALPESTG
jgi:diguanylate cyclase (GGDEF)-like protein